jgi:hypothetical protein
MRKPNKNNDQIVNDYINTETDCTKLSIKYNMSPTGVACLLKRNNIQIRQIQGHCSRKYNINENYFEKINSEDKAYFLGLLYADGWNSGEGFRLSLQEKDSHILDKFKEKIGYSGEIKFCKKGKSNWQNQLALTIYSRKISNDLIKLGCGESKSLVIDFPNSSQVPKELLSHFIRGCFDGDGCFYISQNTKKKNSISMVSSSQFIYKLKDFLETIDISSSTYNIGKVRCIEIKGLINGINKIKFLNWLYKDSSIFLKRKFDKQLEIRKCYE